MTTKTGNLLEIICLATICSIILLTASCKKENSPGSGATGGSSEKSIHSFLFSDSSNNYMLGTDINGDIGPDTIRLIVPGGISITNLVPSISFTGKTVTPANGTAEDFSNPVSYSVTADNGTTITYVVIVTLSSVPYSNMIFFGSGDSKFYAVDLLTGKIKWTFNSNGPISSSATVSNGLVFVGNTNSTIYALDALSGTLIWQNNYGGNSGILTPAAYRGSLYISINNVTSQSTLLALNQKSGAINVSSVYNTSAMGNIITAPAAGGNTVYLGVGNSVSSASIFPPYGGWNTTVEDSYLDSVPSIQSDPTLCNGNVYFGCNDSSFYALDAASGAIKWSAKTGNVITSSATVDSGFVYIGSRDHNLYAFNATTGKESWSASLGSAIESSPTVAKGIVYVGCDDGYIYAFNASTGVSVFKTKIGSAVYSSPAVSGGLVWIGSNDNNLYALNALTGQVKFQIATDGVIKSSPFIVSSNGDVYMTRQ